MRTNHTLWLNSKLKMLLLACFFAILVVSTRFINVQEILQPIFIWFQNQLHISPITFIIIYNLGTLLFIPGSLLTLQGGYLFGLFWGSLYVLVAAIFGAILAFLIGRYLSRDWVFKQLEKHPRFRVIDQAVAKEGWKIVLLTRLSPVFPFNLLNYAFGVTQVSLKDYTLGSFGILPGTIMYVYIGSLAGNITMINTANKLVPPELQFWQFLLQGIGLISTVSITIYTTNIAKKALLQTVETTDSQQNQD